jgi:uncharacterized protein with HEPN domain
MKRDYTLYLQDILDCIEKIDEFVGDMDYEEFVDDDKTSSAVVRKLEIMGEAAKNKTPSGKIRALQLAQR